METEGDGSDNLTKNLDRALDEYEKAIGLNYTSITDEAEKYLTYSQAQIEKMTHQECASASILLSQLSFHLQRSVNKERARAGWCGAKIREFTGRKMSGYVAYSYEERREMALSESDVSQKLERLRVQVLARVDRLTELTFPINAMSKTFQVMSQRGNNGA